MKIINTSSAPAAIGPYSQGIVSNGFLFTSGQVPLVPEDMSFIDGTIEEQTRRVLENLDAILTAAGTSWSRVVKTTVYMIDLADFGTMNTVYEQHLGEARPARSTVQVAALPRGAKVEIDLVAEVG
ncbi:MAG: RidA family protein [Planctomycetaceae bacterium]|nr:RidA family protein [Planctomycetaceae bacterium]